MVFVRRSGMGFKLGKRTVNLCRWILRRRTGYLRLESSGHTTSRRSCSAISRLRRWARGLKKIRSRAAEAAAVCFSRAGLRGYRSLNEGGGEAAVPKGHLAVYVGQKDGDCRRVLVPVVYFNHPLFGELLREAEEEYGFHHPPGGITIPCRISEFESVRTRVAAVHSCHRRHHPTLF